MSDGREVYAPLPADHPRLSIRDLLGVDPAAEIQSARGSEIRAAEERGRQQGWREAIEQAARNAEGQLGSVLLTPRQFAMWLRQYLSSVAPTEGTQTE